MLLEGSGTAFLLIVIRLPSRLSITISGIVTIEASVVTTLMALA